MNSDGHNGTRAWLQCLSQLVEENKRWKYVVVLQVSSIYIKPGIEKGFEGLSSEQRRASSDQR